MGDRINTRESCSPLSSVGARRSCEYLEERCVDQAREGARPFVIETPSGDYRTADTLDACIEEAKSVSEAEGALPRFSAYESCEKEIGSGSEYIGTCFKLAGLCAETKEWPIAVRTESGDIPVSDFTSCKRAAVNLAAFHYRLVLDGDSNPVVVKPEEKGSGKEAEAAPSPEEDSSYSKGQDAPSESSVNPIHPFRLSISEGMQIMNAGLDDRRTRYYGDYTQLALNLDLFEPMGLRATFGRSWGDANEEGIANMHTVNLGLGLDVGTPIDRQVSFRMQFGGGCQYFKSSDSGSYDDRKDPLDFQPAPFSFAGLGVYILHGAIGFNATYQHSSFGLRHEGATYDDIYAADSFLFGATFDMPISVAGLTGWKEERSEKALKRLRE